MIKKSLFLRLSLLLICTLFIQNSVAQDYTRWNLPEGAKMRLGKGRISEIAYSPDGTRLAVASTIGIWLYDTAPHKEVALLTGHTSLVNSVAFSPDGGTLASGSLDHTICLWDTITGVHKHTLTRHTGLRPLASRSVPMDAHSLVGVRGECRCNNTIRLWDVVAGKHKHTLTGHTDSVKSIAFSPDGRTLASGSGGMWGNNTIRPLGCCGGYT